MLLDNIWIYLNPMQDETIKRQILYEFMKEVMMNIGKDNESQFALKLSLFFLDMYQINHNLQLKSDSIPNENDQEKKAKIEFSLIEIEEEQETKARKIFNNY